MNVTRPPHRIERDVLEDCLDPLLTLLGIDPLHVASLTVTPKNVTVVQKFPGGVTVETTTRISRPTGAGL